MTTLECIGEAFWYSWPTGKILLAPGKPVELQNGRAARLIAKAPGRCRVVAWVPEPGDTITWPRADLTMQVGVVDFVHIDAAGSSWAFVSVDQTWVAVNTKFAKSVAP